MKISFQVTSPLEDPEIHLQQFCKLEGKGKGK